MVYLEHSTLRFAVLQNKSVLPKSSVAPTPHQFLFGQWQFFHHNQGCQMAYFQTKNPNLGKLLRALDWKMLLDFMAICNILQTFGIFYDHSVH
jgi:hypothetical protein